MSWRSALKFGLLVAGILALGLFAFFGVFSTVNELRTHRAKDEKALENKPGAKNDLVMKKGEPVDVEKIKQSNWYAGVMDTIDADQRKIMQKEDKTGLLAVNPRNNYQSEFSKKGATLKKQVEVPSKVTENPPAAAEESSQVSEVPNKGPEFTSKTLFRYKLTRLEINGKAEDLAEIEPTYKDYVVTYNRIGITEIYENNKDGIDQKFIIDDPLTKSEKRWRDIKERAAPLLRKLGFKLPEEKGYSIIVEADFQTDLIARQTNVQGVDLFDNGKIILHYQTPAAQDAQGKILGTRFDYRKGKLNLIIAVTPDTQYPIYIGPWKKQQQEKTKDKLPKIGT